MKIVVRRGLAAVLPLALVACGSESAFEPALPLTTASDIQSQIPFETLVVCKEGSDASFAVSHVGGNAPTSLVPQVSLLNQECAVVANGIGSEIRVLELAAVGATFDSVRIMSRLGLQPVVERFEYDPDVTLRIGNDQGHLVTFFNTVTPPPPPPPGGGEGCTPGYWKQKHHFDSWVGYAPTDLFSSVFEDAFPGMTLVQVLGQGGGGLKALGRHTVAALLNSANAGVSYDVTTADVIDGFNAVFPGGDYNGLKDTFEGYNEQGCPLN